MSTATRVANAWGKTMDNREEAESFCYMQLCQIIDTTPDEKCNQVYVAEALRNTLRRRNTRSKKLSAIPEDALVSMDGPLSGQEHLAEFETLHDVLSDENAICPEAAAVSKVFVHKVLSRLPELQRKLVSYHLGLDEMDPIPMDRCAKRLRISRTVAYYELAAAKKVLRAELTALGIAPKTDADLQTVLRAA
jgi:hypothetical protein